MIKRFVKRLLNLVRRAIGIPILESKILELNARLESMVRAQGQVVNYVEGRYRSLAALSMPMIMSAEITQKDILDFCNLLAPFEVEGFKKIRLGNKHDGGYIFIDDLAAVSVVISCGISNDVTFDLACAEMGKPVIQFDHTVQGPPVQHPKFKFRKQAIDALGTIPGSVKLWEIVREEGDPAKSDLLLKIDIDGDEWSTFANFPVDQLKRFRQISCELHWSSRLKDPEYFHLCFRALSNIHAGFFPIHLHANNFQGFANLMGVPVPEVYEVTFVNRELYRPAGHQRGAPTSLDNPNDETKPDMVLSSPFHIS